MFADNNLYFADGLAYGTTSSSELDLGLLPGNTEKITVWVTGTGLTASTAVTIDVQSSATSGSGHATDMLVTRTAAEWNEGVFIDIAAKDLNRYVKLVLGGTISAGTWSAFIVDGKQSAQ